MAKSYKNNCPEGLRKAVREYYDWHGDKRSFAIRILENRSKDRMVLARFVDEDGDKMSSLMFFTGSDWCPWCIRFANFATTDSVIAPLIERNFVYVHINYSKANKNPEAMKYLGNPARFGFPVFVILDEEGKPIHIQESASLEEGKSYDLPSNLL